MISGASQADVALLMVPADGNFTTSIAKGNLKAGEVQGQTRQHALLLNLLGVKQLIIGVNKMDCEMAKYSQERFDEIKNEMALMLTKVGWKKDFVKNSVAFLPISGFKGDNLVKKTTNMDWWKGVDVTLAAGPKTGEKIHVDTLVDVLEKVVYIPERNETAVMRMPVGSVLKIKGVGDVITGRVEQGNVKPGTEVKFLPTHTKANPCTGKIFTVEMHNKSVPAAGSGMNVGLNVKSLDRSNMPKPGDMMVLKSDTTVGAVKSFIAQIKVLTHPGKLKVGYSPIGFVRTSRSALKMAEIQWNIGKSTGGKKVESPPFLEAGDAAQVVFEPLQPFVVDAYGNCEGLGRIAIMEGNSVVMLGKVLSVVLKE
jgi:elongation factor 1-alpha